MSATASKPITQTVYIVTLLVNVAGRNHLVPGNFTAAGDSPFTISRAVEMVANELVKKLSPESLASLKFLDASVQTVRI